MNQNRYLILKYLNSIEVDALDMQRNLNSVLKINVLNLSLAELFGQVSEILLCTFVKIIIKPQSFRLQIVQFNLAINVSFIPAKEVEEKNRLFLK